LQYPKLGVVTALSLCLGLWTLERFLYGGSSSFLIAVFRLFVGGITGFVWCKLNRHGNRWK